jgi:hypothetical protein
MLSNTVDIVCTRLTSAAYKPATTEVQRFWEALPRAHYTYKLLRLEAGTHFLGVKRYGSQLWIRDHWYDAIQQKMNEHFSNDGEAIAVVGSSGKQPTTSIICN